MALPLILHYSLNKTDILKTNHNCEKGMFKNVKISIESLFFLRGLKTATVCAHKVSQHTYVRYSICMHTPFQTATVCKEISAMYHYSL